MIGKAPYNLRELANLFLDIFSVFVPVIIAAALILFLYGIAKFIAGSDNEQTRTEGKTLMIWGVVALFVMISVWGLVQILTGTFGIDAGTVPFFPAP